jgi:BASS family bile acid:Na+ symporter
LIAFGLSNIFQLPVAFAVGLIITGCCPGGTTSNVMSYWAGGDVALSIAMTVCSTSMAIVLLPVLLFAYTSPFDTSDLQVDRASMVGQMIMVLIPVGFGMCARKKSLACAAKIEKIGSIFGSLMILIMTIFGMAVNYEYFFSGWQAFVAGFLQTTIGFIAGMGICTLVKLPNQKKITVSLETGIQNGPLAIAIATLSFDCVAAQQVVIMPCIYSFFTVIQSIMFAKWARATDFAQRDVDPTNLRTSAVNPGKKMSIKEGRKFSMMPSQSAEASGDAMAPNAAV